MTDDAWIDVVRDGVGATPLAVVDRRRAVEVSPRLDQVPTAEQHGPPRHVRLQEEVGVLRALGQDIELLHQLRGDGLAATAVAPVQAEQDAEVLERVLGPSAELPGALVGAGDLRRRLALGAVERQREGDLEIQLASPPRAGIDISEAAQGLGEIADRVVVREAFERAHAREVPVRDGLADESPLQIVMRHQLRPRVGDVGEALGERPRDAAVGLLACAPEQRLIRDVVGQGVLERVLALGKQGGLIEELRRLQALQAALQLLQSVLLVEQNVHHSLRLADRVHVLENGRVVRSGTPAELRQDKAIQQAYLGL
jgi:hypothetical protein